MGAKPEEGNTLDFIIADQQYFYCLTNRIDCVSSLRFITLTSPKPFREHWINSRTNQKF